jgi:hypothetical protein
VGGGVGQADAQQGALLAFGLPDGFGGDAGLEELVQTGRRVFGGLPQGFVEVHFEAAAGLAVEERAPGHGLAEHFFQAQGLSAELDLVRTVGFGAAALVFDGIGEPGAGVFFGAVELDDVRLSREAEPEAAQRQAADDPEVPSGFGLSAVRPLVEMGTLDGQRVVHPDPLEVDESALALTEEQVLEGGEREEVVFGKHFQLTSRSFTPAGTRSRWTVTS